MARNWSENWSEKQTASTASTADAIEAMRAMDRLVPALEAAAKAITGNPDMKVRSFRDSGGQGGGSVDKEGLIMLAPPITLKDIPRHSRQLCASADADGTPLCLACKQLENVLAVFEHEVAHHVQGTLDAADRRRMKPVIEAACDVKEASLKEESDDPAEIARLLKNYRSKQSNETRQNGWDAYVKILNRLAMGAGFLLNALEDGRVNTNLYRSRPGTLRMMKNRRRDDFSLEVMETNPPEAQFAIGCLIKTDKAVSDDKMDNIHPVIRQALESPEAEKVFARLAKADHASVTAVSTLELINIAKKYGMFLSQKELDDFKEQQKKNGEEPDNQDPSGPEESPDNANDDNTAPEGDQDCPQGQTPPDGGLGDPDGDSEDSGPNDNEEDNEDDDNSGDASGSSTEGDDTDDTDDTKGEDSDDTEGREDSDSGSGDNSGDASSPSEGEGSDDGDDEDRHEDDGHDDQQGGGSDSLPAGGDGQQDGEDEEDDNSRNGDDSGSESPSDGSEGGQGEDDEASGSDMDGEGAGDEQGEEVKDDAGDDDGGDSSGDPLEEFLDEMANRSSRDVDDAGRDAGNMLDKYTSGLGTDDWQMGENISDLMKRAARSSEHVDDLGAMISEVVVARWDEVKEGLAKRDERFFSTPMYQRTIDSKRDRENNPGTPLGSTELGRFNYIEKADEAIIAGARAAVQARLVFASNAPKDRRNQTEGRLQSGAAASVRRGSTEVFRRKVGDKKKSYFVSIILDNTGSGRFPNGNNLVPVAVMKAFVLAQAELLHQLRIPFEILTHTTGEDAFKRRSGMLSRVDSSVRRGSKMMAHIIIKGEDEPWSQEIKERLASVDPAGGNADGHAFAMIRKRITTRKETKKIVLYYTDGEMPSWNRAVEADILTKEIERMRRDPSVVTLGIGLDTDSPSRYGLDTVIASDPSDILSVVNHLAKVL